jgi:hypothetical protein
VDRFSDFQIVEARYSSRSNNTHIIQPTTTTGSSNISDLLLQDGQATVTGTNATVEITNEAVNVNDIATRFGDNVLGSDINVEVRVGEQTAADIPNTHNALAQTGLNIVGKPIVLDIKATYNTQVQAVTTFGDYVSIVVPIEDNKITTAVTVCEDGSIIHIPTEVMVIDASYYAKINSLVSGTFALIWNPQQMSDVANHWAKEDVNDMYSRLIVTGVGDNKYDPERDITRAEFATIIVRGLGLLRGTGELRFDDVEEISWYSPYIKTAASYGIINGYGDGSFGPQDKITREQAMTMIARAMKITGLDALLTSEQKQDILDEFTDNENISKYAEDSAADCIKTGIIVGRNGNIVAPKDYITRAEVAAVIRRFLQKSELI